MRRKACETGPLWVAFTPQDKTRCVRTNSPKCRLTFLFAIRGNACLMPASPTVNRRVVGSSSAEERRRRGACWSLERVRKVVAETDGGVNQRQPLSGLTEKVVAHGRMRTHERYQPGSSASDAENRISRKYLALLGIIGGEARDERSLWVSTTGDLNCVGENIGSSGRTRTYNPSVNRRAVPGARQA